MKHLQSVVKRTVYLRRTVGALLCVAILAFAGCGGQQESDSEDIISFPPPSMSKSSAEPSGGEAAKASGVPPASNASLGSTARLVQVASAVPRKIIYNATVDLVSDNFSAAEQKLMQLIRAHKGYIAQRNVNGTTGAPRTGTWKIRIPVDSFDVFMTEIAKLGELQTINTDSQDVSEEFYDLQARISNKQIEEKRLLQHLQKSTGKLTEILKVEQELSRVRGEIEQMQGRLRVLSNLTALTTVTATIREVKDYVPPAPPTFRSEVARTFQASLSSMRNLGKGVVLMIVAFLPWLVVLAIVGLPVYLRTRRRWPRRAASPSSQDLL